jgi:signal transduction histidine kinase/ligand-binding sensor domain-containing protein/DNA-binding response OmpR family regulator
VRTINTVLLFFSAIRLFAQTDKVTYLSIAEGLSSQQVLDVTHDRDGYIWIATEMGLNRFSSNSFKTFYKSEIPDGKSLNSNEINTLLYDNDQLYIGTRANGLNVLNLKNNRFSYYTHNPQNNQSIATNDITDIIKSKTGKLWLATYHQGVQRFNPLSKTFEHYNRKNIPGFPENSIWSLAEDKHGQLYIGHVHKGLSIFDPVSKSITVLSFESTGGKLPDNEVKALYADRRGNIWIGTRKGLAVYYPQSHTLKNILLASKTKSHNEPFVHSIKEINGTVYIGAESSQLFILQPAYRQTGELSEAISILPVFLQKGNNSSIQNIDLDAYGNVWLGVYSGGIAFMSHLKPHFSLIPGANTAGAAVAIAAVTGILPDTEAQIWLATAGDGILNLQLNGDIVRRSGYSSNLKDDFLLSAFEDSKGNKWFGSQDKGVYCFERKTGRWRMLSMQHKMKAVRAIVEDRHGNICFAAEDGLFIYNPVLDTFKIVLTNKPMLGDYAPRTLVEDGSGNLWVGTYGQGLYIFDGRHQLIRRIIKGEGIPSNTINHLFKDHRNNIWIATNEGLALQKVSDRSGMLTVISPSQLNSSLTVNAIAEDHQGNIWCSTRLGLLRYIPSQERFLYYDHSFGLPLGGFSNNSVAIDKKGQLFFGTPSGLCYFDPARIPLTVPPSPFRISRFIIFNTGEIQSQTEKLTDREEHIFLKHNENSFRVELSVMDYALNDMVEFSYQLHGLDNKWIMLGAEKNLDFRNIPHGDYELRVRTRQKNQEWSRHHRRLLVHISAPYYLSTSALVLYALLAIAIVSIILFFHMRKVYAEAELRVKRLQLDQDEKLHMERMNFYTNITHELRTPLTLILGPLEDLLHEDKLSTRHREWIAVIQKNANRLFSLVNQLLEFRKVESQYKPLVLGEDYLGDLVQQIVQKYAEANVRKNLNIRFNMMQDDIITTFDAEIVQLILDNLLSNACKYTTAGSIEVTLQYEQDPLSTCAIICVTDTGSGIAPEHLEKIFDRYYQVPKPVSQGTGVGLALARELAAIHHGKITVSSELGKGSQFTVRLLTNSVIAEEAENLAKPLLYTNAFKDDGLPVLLLVEDERDLREYLSGVLRKKYEVLTAENGLRGLELARTRIPDVIVSDVMMPDMDGFMMLERLKKERETSHIPIIFLTARDTEADKTYGYGLGVDSYLTKPISPKLLHKRIENLLLKHQTLFADVLAQLPATIHTQPENRAVQKELWRENSFVQEFVKLVEASIQDEVLDAATLAEKMNMSQSTLYRKLKGLTGKNINQLVRKVRIQKAAQLLLSGQYNVTEVALMVGISSSIYFRQCFREEFGELPSSYQKKKR